MNSNKQNNPPNKSAVFRNSLISAKVYTNQNQQSIDFPAYEEVKNQSQSSCESTNAKQSNKPFCQIHLKTFSNLFCAECLTFNVCKACISDQHSQHQVMQFGSHQQMLNQTKEILLQNLQETLKELKRKQNDVKNKAHQMGLIKNSLRALEQDVISLISNLFKDIQAKLTASLEKCQLNFEQDIDNFFNEFNKTNDDLRSSLIKILDGDINILQFNKSMVVKQAPISPNFAEQKNTFEKYKKVFRDVKIQLESVKRKLQEGCNNIQQIQNHHFKANNGFTKFDKYFATNNQKNEKVNQSFMKTLKLLQVGNEKQNLLAIIGKDKGKTKKQNKNEIFKKLML